MTTLRLAIDASGMRTGASEAEDATRKIQRGAAGAAGATADLDDKLRRTGATAQTASAGFQQFQRQAGLANEALSIGNRVRSLTTEFEALGTGMGSASNVALLFGQTLLDVTQTLALARRQAAGAGGIFAGIFGAVRANPLIALVTTLGAVAAGMALFGGSTSTATKEIEKQTSALDQLLRKQEGLQERLRLSARIGDTGFADPRQSSAAAIEALQAIRAQPSGVGIGGAEAGRTFTAQQLLDLLGVDRRQLGVLVGTEQANILQRQRIGGVDFGLQYAQQTFSQDEAARAAENLARERLEMERLFRRNAAGQQPNYDVVPGAPSDTLLGPGTEEGIREQSDARFEAQRGIDDYIASLREETQLLGLSEDVRAQTVAVMQAEQIARQAGLTLSSTEANAIREQIALQQQMQELRALGQETFGAIGSAAFNAITGVSSLRQAVGQLIQEFARMAQARVIQQFASFGGNLFGSTAAQGSQDTVNGFGTGGLYGQ